MKTLEARSLPRKSSQAGFTIIELIVVILLLGILTATALPRFLDVTDEAHTAVVNAVFGGLQTGAALFRAGAVAQGAASGDTVTNFGAGDIEANANGYPLAVDGALGDTDDCIGIYNGLLQAGRPATDATGSGITAAAAIDDDDIAAGAAGVVVRSALQTSAAAPFSANACIYIYTGQYTDEANGTIPIIVYEQDGTITLTDDDTAPFDTP